MKRKSTLSGLFMSLLTLLFLQLNAQDIHFSQFNGSPLTINPGLTGVFDGSQRFSAIVRDQWYNVPVTYQSISGAYDRKFTPKRKKSKGFFAAGLIFDYDIAGDSRLNLSRLGLSGSYTRKLTKKNALSMGFQVAGAQRAFATNDLRFDKQFKYFYDANASNGENFMNTSRLFADLSGGINFEHKLPKSRTNFSAGLGAFHLNRPDYSLLQDQEVKLDPRYALYALGTVMVSKNIDVVVQAFNQHQGPHQETTIAAYGKIHLNHSPIQELALQVGAIMRLGDAIAPAVSVFYNDWEAGFSYDINLSDFEEASVYNGGPELYVKYVIRPIPELKSCPNCPKYL